jgi:hypothetical protein
MGWITVLQRSEPGTVWHKNLAQAGEWRQFERACNLLCRDT